MRFLSGSVVVRFTVAGNDQLRAGGLQIKLSKQIPNLCEYHAGSLAPSRGQTNQFLGAGIRWPKNGRNGNMRAVEAGWRKAKNQHE
jgi:hypothetical protein